ncbi:MAG: SoxR reducing system RseC family protein [Alistipes sp.]
MRGQIEHSGVVERIEGATVFVRITSQSACGTCKAREACGLSESQEKIIEARSATASEYAVGEHVTVGIRQRSGLIAVVLAYVMPLVLLLILLVCTISLLHCSEGCGALIALVGVGLYYGALWLARGRIENKIHITISKE